MAPDPVQ